MKGLLFIFGCMIKIKNNPILLYLYFNDTDSDSIPHLPGDRPLLATRDLHPRSGEIASPVGEPKTSTLHG